MRKSVFLLALALVISLAWCWKGNNKIDITDNNIGVDVCDRYFELMDCILENDNDETYTEEMRDELRLRIKDMQAEWEWLSKDELSDKCTTELGKFEDNEEVKGLLDNIWCSLK